MRKLLVGLLGVVVLAVHAPAAHAAFPGANGKIAFRDTTGTGTSDDIYLMNPGGSGDRRITNNPTTRTGPLPGRPTARRSRSSATAHLSHERRRDRQVNLTDGLVA